MFLAFFPTSFGQQWCPGVEYPSFNNDPIDIIYAQAPLFSSNPAIGNALGDLGLHHTATILKQGDTHYTLEYDLTAQNKPNATLTAGFLPIIQDGALYWDTDAQWCLFPGLLWGQEHWTTAYDTIATVTKPQFDDLYKWVQTHNATDTKYNMWRVAGPLGVGADHINDVTCANGAIWVRDHLKSAGVTLTEPANKWKVSRVTLNALSVSEVDMTDSKNKKDVMDFYLTLYDSVSKLDGSLADKLIAAFQSFHFTYVYEGQTNKYWKLLSLIYGGLPKPGYAVAPDPWPLPGPPAPTPPTPSPAPVPVPPVPAPTPNTGVHYGRPPCQPDEEQISVADGVVCAPACSGMLQRCPEDVPAGTTGSARCDPAMLSATHNRCIVYCDSDDECASDGGVCLKATSFHNACGFPSSFNVI